MYVYFIRAGVGKRKPIKIGVAKSIQKRMENLQIANHEELSLVACIPCKTRKEAEFIEKGLHKRFARKHIRGEWFKGDIRISHIREEFMPVEDDLMDIDEELDMQMLVESSNYY
jgi:hypothetical protein